jgi:hypothetical protein
MAYHLRKKDIPAVQVIIRLLDAGERKIEGDVKRIVYLVQQARNTSFPQLKDYSYRVKEGYVLFQKKTLDIVTIIPTYEDEIDFLGIMQYILEKKPEAILFKNTTITDDKELNKLTSFLIAKQYTIEKDGVSIKCQRQSIL